jgi:hypothetical protein
MGGVDEDEALISCVLQVKGHRGVARFLTVCCCRR